MSQVRDAGCVYLLAFRFNNKLDMFVFSCRNPLMETVDAVVAQWDQYILTYDFPSLKLFLLLNSAGLRMDGIPLILLPQDWLRGI